VISFLSEIRRHDSFSASDVTGDVRGNIGIRLVREIEKHLRLPIAAGDVHGAFVVVAFVLLNRAKLFYPAAVSYIEEGIRLAGKWSSDV